MRKLRILVLMHEDLVPPESMQGFSDEQVVEWKMEYDVLHTLGKLGHEAWPLGVRDELGVLRRDILRRKPHVVFNVLEEFHGVPTYDHHVIGFLELMQQRYTGCNPRGLLLSHDKALSKQILTYHRILTPKFAVFPRKRAVKPGGRMKFPLIVKSATDDASLGISQASIVSGDDKLRDRIRYIHEQVQSDALVEEYIEGRELYVGVMGNQRLRTLPVWEMSFKGLPDSAPHIATARVKWDPKYQKKYGVATAAAEDLPPDVRERMQKMSKRIYRLLHLSGYARIDFRLRPDGRVFFLEANANPNLSFGEDFSESAHAVGISYPDLMQQIVNLGLNYRAPWKG